MKNKVAERAKKKRRALKEAERRKEQENLLKKFNEIAKKHGVNNVKYNKQTLWQTFMKVDKEMVKLSIVYSVMAVAYCLRKTFGWGKQICCGYEQIYYFCRQARQRYSGIK